MLNNVDLIFFKKKKKKKCNKKEEKQKKITISSLFRLKMWCSLGINEELYFFKLSIGISMITPQLFGQSIFGFNLR